ncbi:MAG: hypothetical protein ACQEV6_17860 [Pseudomonadota bacterium]
MRADSLPRIASSTGRYGLLLAVALIAAGCKTDTGPDDPTVLGVPPTEAYLGVEYYYNFGAYGGERILDFSLTNAPSWLALEDTSNKARPGIIMRGVPGLTGGNRGDADLGKQEDINLLTTDDERVGVQPFDIEVKRNQLSLEAETFTEGEGAEEPEARDNRCEAPVVDSKGAHSYDINLYDADGEFIESEPRTSETNPVLVKVLLEQPSVTRVAVAFELSSNYDSATCDQGFSGQHQRCEGGESNRDDAIIGRDIVALGSQSDSDSRLPVPDYLQYQEDDSGYYSKGVITLEPGITECYIRLEVVDDTVSEASESLRLTLTEIRSGLAALGPSDTEVRSTLVIDDNEPVVRLETLDGRQRDAVSVGEAREFVAVLSGEREGAIFARLAETEDSIAKAGDYVIETRSAEGEWEEDATVEFPEGTDRVRFRVAIPDDYTNSGTLNDRFLLLELDQQYQAARENFAGSASDVELRVNINELVTPLVLNGADDFVPTDMAVGHDGRLFVAGYDDANNDQVLVRIFDQKGNVLQEVVVSDAGVELDQPDPVIDFAERQVTEGTSRVERFEFAVAYKAVNDIPAQTSNGGQDVVAGMYWFDSAMAAGSEYTEVWTLRTGTAGDDIPRWVGLNVDNGAVVVAGETTGRWPGATRGGGNDSFLQRIDTKTDGDDRVPELAWTRQVGSPADETVVAGSAATTSPYLFGHTSGAIQGTAGPGDVDGFFFSTSSGDGAIDVYQVGTDEKEVVTDGLYAARNVWLLGNSDRLYSVDRREEGDNELKVVKKLSGDNGFILGYSSSGAVTRAYSLVAADGAGNENFAALLEFDDNLIASGSTLGEFVKEAGSGPMQPILVRVDQTASLTEEGGEDEDASELWRVQAPIDQAEIKALANYRDDEIVALVRQTVAGVDEWRILLFSGEGAQLN